MPVEVSQPAVRLVIAPEAATATHAVVAREPWADVGGHEIGYYEEDGERHRICLRGLGVYVFTRDACVVQGAPEPAASIERFQDAFARHILPFVLQQRSWEVLHASGLVVGGAWVGLGAGTGTGKSTLAYAWRRRGGSVFADDRIPFRVEGEGIVVHPLPFRIRLRPPSQQHFEAASPAANGSIPGDGRGGVAGTGTLDALFLLERRTEETGAVSLIPLRPTDALPALLRQACWLTLRDRMRCRQMVAAYAVLADTLPVFRLSYPTRFVYVDQILDRILDHVQSPVPERTAGRERLGHR